jgi:N-acetylglutamate synthase-like GNAT family acetyltransferase
MQIFEATQEDSSSIVQLLKSSLGESLLPKSVDYWNWKHHQNSFGESKVLLAKENDQLIGVRAFMKWQWQNEMQTVSAVRAVDTATHPRHQGKGVFSKLTMAALEQCKSDGVQMVFNTPNKKSMPGYIKMGWMQAGKMKLMFRVGAVFPKKFDAQFCNEVCKKFNPSDTVEHINTAYQTPQRQYQTTVTSSYFKWRYIDCPIINYGSLILPGEAFVVFRLKKIGSFIELRICDVWQEPVVPGVKPQ